MTKLQKWIFGITGAVILSLTGWIFWYVSQTQLTTQLGTLFNVLLTIFSIIISLIVSQYYFDSSRQQTIEEIKADYKKNNKLYSQKAAEKVDNLSNELTKLSIYLQQSIDDNGSENPATTLLVQEEKIRSAIHIVETLKSINDRSLSDWLGVLDEEDIEEQNEIREEQREERESGLKSILDNYKFIAAENSNLVEMKYDYSSGADQLDTVHTDINELTKKIDKLATSIIGTPIKTRKATMAKEKVELPCPSCQTLINYRQRPSATSVKGLKCMNCSTKLVARWSPYEGFTLSIKPAEYIGSAAPRELPEEIVEKVKDALPSQPWPKGTSQEITKELGINSNDMRRAIDILIARGIFKVQVDGVLYDPVKAKKTTTKTTTKATVQAESV